MNRTRILMIAGMAVLGVVAILGWIRKPEVTPAQTWAAPGAPGYNNSIAPAENDVQAAEVPSYATRPAVRTITRAQPRSTQPAYADRGAAPSRPSHRAVTQERPFSHSAAIVGAGAGAGAAIGAVAGGGKGAAIGALSGGAAGLVYDRLTHKKRVEEQ